jgi:hypothetical protein
MYFLGSFSIFYKIPPDNELKITAGNLIYENYDGRPKIAISTPEGKIYFTSQQPNDKGGSRIPITTKKAKSLEGKPVTIYWYRRLFFIGVYQNHIVKMQSENKMLVTRQKTDNEFKHHSISTTLFLITLTLIVIFFVRRERLRRQSLDVEGMSESKQSGA